MPEIRCRFVSLSHAFSSSHFGSHQSCIFIVRIFFFQTVCLTQHWKCYQKGVMGSRDAKSLSLAGILEVRAYLEWQNTLMSAMHVVRANPQSFSSPHFCLQRHTRVHIRALSLPKYPLPFNIGTLWHRHTQYENNPLDTAAPERQSILFLL